MARSQRSKARTSAKRLASAGRIAPCSGKKSMFRAKRGHCVRYNDDRRTFTICAPIVHPTRLAIRRFSRRHTYSQLRCSSPSSTKLENYQLTDELAVYRSRVFVDLVSSLQLHGHTLSARRHLEVDQSDQVCTVRLEKLPSGNVLFFTAFA